MLDYLAKPDFRREVHRNLSQGESVHPLQRAILSGRIEAKHGREMGEITAISGAQSLLTNIVMVWNTAAMQRETGKNHESYPPAHLAHISPVAFRLINMHGKLHFPVRQTAFSRFEATQ